MKSPRLWEVPRGWLKLATNVRLIQRHIWNAGQPARGCSLWSLPVKRWKRRELLGYAAEVKLRRAHLQMLENQHPGWDGHVFGMDRP